MTVSIRGKKRQEYIQRWLNGEEDPEVEVMPTRVEGKYIVRPRGGNQSQEEETTESPVTDTVNTSSNKDTEDSSSYYSEYEEEEIPERQTPKRKGKKINQNDIQLEILHHLRIMGEEAIKKREKKERKREMKHVVRKEMSRQDRYYDYDDSDSDDYEEVAPPPHYANQRSVQQRYTATPQAARYLAASERPGSVAGLPCPRPEEQQPQVIYRAPSYKRRTLNLLSDYR